MDLVTNNDTLDDDRPHRVVVVEEVRAHRDGLASVAAHTPGLELVGALGSLAELADADVRSLDGMLLQASSPRADHAGEIIRARELARRSRIVAVLPWVDVEVTAALVGLGATRVLSCDTPLAHVFDALLGAGGEITVDPLDATGRAQAAAGRLAITASELAVLWRLGEGHAPQRIAHDTGRSVDTVRDHLRSLRSKLHCGTATELVVAAYRHGLLPRLGRDVSDVG